MRRVIAAAAIVAATLMPLALPADAKTAPLVSFITPSNGATVASPVEVALKVTGLQLAPAGSLNKPGFGHVHILIDQTPPAIRSFLPTNDPNVVHFGQAPLDARAIDLTDGPHTLYAVLGDSDHLVIAHQPSKITITVAPGVHAIGPLPSACAEVARGNGDVRIAFPTDGGLVQGTIASTCLFPTNGGQCVWAETAFRRINGTFASDTQAITAEALGYSTRQLKQGSAQTCGANSTAGLARQSFTGSYDGTTVTGSLGRVALTLATADAVPFSPPAALASPAGATGAAASTAVHKKWQDHLKDYLPFIVAAGILIGAASYIIQNRQRPTTPAP